MTRYTIAVFGIALLALAGCADDKKDYNATSKCQEMGHQPGTKDYDQCVSDEKTATLMEEQQREFDEMKQQQQDWTLRRY